MKYTTYEQIKNATEQELIDIDPDDYTDEEHNQILFWMTKAEQERIPTEKLLGISEGAAKLICLDNEYFLNDVISEAPEKFTIDGKTIIRREVITYPEFSIIKEDGKNNYYRIYLMK